MHKKEKLEKMPGDLNVMWNTNNMNTHSWPLLWYLARNWWWTWSTAPPSCCHTCPPSSTSVLRWVHSISARRRVRLPHLYFWSRVACPLRSSFPSQLNQSQSNVAALVEVLSGRRKLWALGELAAMEVGYRQTVEVRHSFPQVPLR